MSLATSFCYPSYHYLEQPTADFELFQLSSMPEQEGSEIYAMNVSSPVTSEPTSFVKFSFLQNRHARLICLCNIIVNKNRNLYLQEQRNRKKNSMLVESANYWRHYFTGHSITISLLYAVGVLGRKCKIRRAGFEVKL